MNNLPGMAYPLMLAATLFTGLLILARVESYRFAKRRQERLETLSALTAKTQGDLAGSALARSLADFLMGLETRRQGTVTATVRAATPESEETH